MNHKKIAIDDRRDIPVKTERGSYSQPVLRIYGSVRKLTLGGAGTGQDGGGVGMQMVSDRSAKEQVTRIGDHPLGIGLYAFFYKPEHRDAWGHGVQIGVMADEVETVLPEAVSVNSAGYKTVNYAMLDVVRVLR